MNFSTYRFTLDLQKHQSQMSISVFQYDTAVRLYISLTDGGNPYYIEEGVTAILYGKKADGTSLIHPCMIENNTRLIYDFNEKTASEVGVVNCKIRLYQGGKEILTAPRFIIVVDERLVTDEDIDIQDESLTKGDLSALDQVLAKENERIEAENVRVANENERKANELARIGDESTRFSNELERVVAETERKTAETARLEAEAERESNEEERKANEAARAEAEIKRNEFDERKVDKIAFDPSDLNGANGILYSRYVENGEVHDGGVVFGDVPNEGDIVQRAWNGNIALPTDHSLIDDDGYAVPKGYVDAGLAVLQTGLEKGLENKPDRRTEKKAVYATNTTGEQSYILWSGGADANTIVRRTARGTVAAKTPTEDNDAATKKYVDDFKEAVENTVDYTDSLIVALDKRVEYLEEQHSMLYVEDETQAYEKIVPAKAYTTAMLKEVGGNTYRKLSENLIDPSKIEAVIPYDMPITVTPTSGIAFKIPASAEGFAVLRIPAPSENGVYKYKVYIEHTETSTISYTPSANIILVEYDLEINFYTNPSSTVNPSTGENGYYEDVPIRAWIVMVKDDTRTSDTIEIEWGTDLIYRPYGSYGNVFEIAKTERVESYGANLIPFPYKIAVNQFAGGVSVIANADGGITLKGMATKTDGNYISAPIIINTPTSLSIGSDIIIRRGGIPSVRAYKRDIKGSESAFLNTAGSPGQTAYAGTDIISVRAVIYLTKDVEYDCTIYPKLNYGAEAAPFKVYSSNPLTTLNLPNSVLNDPDYGLKINDDYRNYIELGENKVIYHKKAYKFVFENRGANSIGDGVVVENNTVYRYKLNASVFPELYKRKVVSNIYDGRNLAISDRLDSIDYLTNKEGFYLNFYTATASGHEIFVKSPYSDKEDTIAWLNGTAWVLALETPEEIDITEDFKACNPNFGDILGKIHTGEIFVEGGGTVRFCNGAEAAVDSVIQYGVRGVY